MMVEKSQNLNGVYIFLTAIAVLVLVGMLVGNAYKGPTQAEFDASVSEVLKAELALLSIPSVEDFVDALPEVQEIVIPEIENADNERLNKFLNREFNEDSELEAEAEADAMEEFEDDNYEVVFDYLESLREAIDEDSLIIDVDEIEVTVTALGLEEDSDKCATVLIEFEVEYELEEGVRDEFELDLVAEFNVCYEEGDFSDEDVELISLA